MNDEPEETPSAPEEPTPPEDAPAPEAPEDTSAPEAEGVPGSEGEAAAPDATAEPPEDASSPEAETAPDSEGEAAAPNATASDQDASSEAEAEQPVAEPEAPVAAAAPTEAAPAEEEAELAPRQRPEIPGADLIPDIIPEGEEFLDAEERAAAEAEAEARAERERAEREDDQAQPIADAAIDLAAGARYTATGKRKTAVARVILKPGSGTYAINGKLLDDFFPRETLRRVIRQPLETVGYESRMDVVARMHGGGVAAQAEALRHGISRALIVADPHLRGELKRRGFLTRDPRVKERKKAGLKKARKRPQFSKR